MKKIVRAVCASLTGFLVSVVVAGCSQGSGVPFVGGSTASASTPQAMYTWQTEQLSTSGGVPVSALAELAAVGSSALAAAVTDQVLIDGNPELIGAEVLSLASASDGLSASTVAGIYQRSTNGWELVLDGPNGPAALAEAGDRLYAFSDFRLDLYTQGTWTHHNGMLPNGWRPTAAVSHAGGVWVGGQTTDGPAFLSQGTELTGFTQVASGSFVSGPDEVQRVTDLLSADGELFVAVGTFARASGAPLRGEVLMLTPGGLAQVLMFQQDVPAALASLGGVLFVGTLSGRLLNNEMGTLWQPEPGLPPNNGIHSLLVYEGNLVVGAEGLRGAVLMTRLPDTGSTSTSGGTPGASGLPADVATALNDCTGCHAWATDLAQVTARVDTADPPNSSLLLSAVNSTPHPVGAIWTTTGNANYDTVLAWIQNGAPASASGAGGGGGATAPGGTFTHSWPLTGGHAQANCTDCHQNNVFAGTPTDCASCHIDDYNLTTAPAHLASGYPTDCQSCHTTSGFAGATFTHPWPFEGAHVRVANDCTSCHQGGVFAGTSTDCFSCHQQDFVATVQPQHMAAGFPTDCTGCHTTDTFAAANFTHKWPFTGAHVAQAKTCNACHGDQVYAGRSTACYSCHSQDYLQAVPNHTASGFSTNCQTCHSTTQFAGATFNHRFPQNHRNANSCSSCHPDANNFADFSCFGCHGQNETNNEHRGRNGYSYNNAACVSCHPDGRS